MVHSHSCDANPWWYTCTHVTLTLTIFKASHKKSCKCSVCTHSCRALCPLGVSVKSCFVKSLRFTHSEHIWEKCLRTTFPWTFTMYKQLMNYISLKNAGVDVEQSHPLCGEHYSQYQASSAALGWPAMTRRWGLLSHTREAVRWLAMTYVTILSNKKLGNALPFV